MTVQAELFWLRFMAQVRREDATIDAMRRAPCLTRTSC
jgi:hypothetical protein